MCKYCCVVLLILCLFSFSCFCLCFCLCFCFCFCLCIWLCWFICLFFCTSLQSNDKKTIGMASHPFASHILFLNKFLVSKKRFSWFWLLTSTWSLVMLIFSSKSPGFLNNWPPEMKKNIWIDHFLELYSYCWFLSYRGPFMKQNINF